MVTEHMHVCILMFVRFLKIISHIYVHVCSLGIEHNYVHTQTNTST